jgi:glucosylceramidase
LLTRGTEVAKHQWDRRQILQLGTLAATASLARTVAGQQLPPPQLLTDALLTLTTTIANGAWQSGSVYKPTFQWDMLNLNISAEDFASAGESRHIMQGFGACFNELGWTALNKLSSTDRESVMRELFHPSAGARFSYCRMPIGANDFSTEAYSYDEIDGDFDLKHFSIEHDRTTLIPFIRAAQQQNPALRLWASPWTPPSWMKRNGFYAEAEARGGWKQNGIRPDQVGHEGDDFFNLEPRYLDAYARYFGKFIESYRAEGIHVGMVMPQNEFNSAQNFPSCTWTPRGLIQFVRALGPEMHKLDVDIFFGTLERGNPKLFETVQADPIAGPFLKGIGVQWAGKNALPALNQRFPDLPIYGSEQECGDGTNTWSYTGYCWDLMKAYFRNGARGYMYWNIALEQGGKSTWGWSQNSLVLIDAVAKRYRYTPDYYLLKHLTHFVEVGASILPTTGTCDNVLAFRNPSGTAAVLLRNELPHAQFVQVQLGSRAFAVELPPDSINTITVVSDETSSH